MIVAFERQRVDVCYVEPGVSLLNGEHGQIFRDKLHIPVMRRDSFVDQKACLGMLLLWVGRPEIAAPWTVRGNHILATVGFLNCYDVNFCDSWIREKRSHDFFTLPDIVLQYSYRH